MLLCCIQQLKSVHLRGRKGQTKVNWISWHFREIVCPSYSKSMKEQLAVLAEEPRVVKKQSVYEYNGKKIPFKPN